MKRVVPSLLVAALAACQGTVDQEITGKLHYGALPQSQTEVRLHTTTSCTGAYESKVTDLAGRFAFRTESYWNVAYPQRQTLTICRHQGLGWGPIWTSTHDSSIKKFRLDCDVGRSPECVRVER